MAVKVQYQLANKIAVNKTSQYQIIGT